MNRHSHPPFPETKQVDIPCRLSAAKGLAGDLLKPSVRMLIGPKLKLLKAASTSPKPGNKGPVPWTPWFVLQSRNDPCLLAAAPERHDQQYVAWS